MKKTLIALAALAATGAFAQSSVTLSGIMDVGVESIQKQATQLQTSRNGTTNLTFSGVEDMGAGLKARFFVSTAFDPSYDNGVVPTSTTSNAGTGTSAIIGNNNMYLALDGGFGSVVMGRPMTTLYAFQATPFGTKGVTGFAATNTVSSAGVFAANTVQYVSPTMGGLSAQLEWNAAENSNTASGGALGLKYANGPLMATLVRSMSREAGVLATSTVTPSVGISQIAASYDFKVVKAMVTMQREDAATATNGQNAYILGVSAPVGANGTVLVQYGNKDDNTNGVQSITSIGYRHNLSKRTAVYVNYGNRNDSAATAQASTLGAGSNSGAGLGLTHSF